MTEKRTKKANFVKASKRKKNILIQKSKRFSQDIKSIKYQDYLIESLKDPEEAAGYLNAALFGGDIKVFLLALQNVVQARGGVAILSERTHKSRTSLYKSLSEKGNPYLKSANELLIAMGMHLAVVPDKKRAATNR